MKRLLSAWLLLALPALAGWDLFWSPDPDVEAGNRHFAAGEFASAITAYRRALEQGEDLPGIHFNLGTALHQQARRLEPGPDRQRQFEEAELSLRRAADARDRRLKSAAYYNLGNLLYDDGRYDDAVEAYKKALRADLRNADARYNLELALRRRDERREQEQGGGRLAAPGQAGDQEQEDQQEQPDQQESRDPEREDRPEEQEPDPRQEQDPERESEPPETDAEQPEADRPEFESRSNTDRKLDELERRSRNLRLRRMRELAGGWLKKRSKKDW